MEPHMKINTVLHLDRDYVAIPTRFMHRWSHELKPNFTLRGTIRVLSYAIWNKVNGQR
ncbi:hypothetical protein AAZX31_17G178500 [Glycine max]